MNKIVLSVCVLALILACGLCASAASTAWAETEREIEAAKLQVASAPAEPLPEISEDTIVAVFWIVIGILVIWLIWHLIKSGHLIALLVLALAVAAIWFFIGGDKTGDGIGDSQIIAVVQPVGDQPETDLIYAEVNQENGKANIITAGAFLLYVLAFLALVIGLMFLFVMKHG